MGSSVSKNLRGNHVFRGIVEHGHDPMFYKATECALVGNYTTSELYFHQLLRKSTFFPRYGQLLGLIESRLRGSADVVSDFFQKVKETPAVDGSPSKAQSSLVERKVPAENAGSDDVSQQLLDETLGPAPSSSPNHGTSAGKPKAVYEFRLPATKDDESLHDFLQFAADIQSVYIICNTAKAHRLALLYAQVNCVINEINVHLFYHLQTDIAAVRQKRMEEQAKLATESGVDAVHAATTSNNNSSAKYVTESDRVQALDLAECFSWYLFVNDVVNFGALALNYAEQLTVSTQLLVAMDAAAQRKARRQREANERRQRVIYKNVEDVCQVLVNLVWAVIERNPEEYLSLVLARTLPAKVTLSPLPEDGVTVNENSPSRELASGVPAALRIHDGSSKDNAAMNDPNEDDGESAGSVETQRFLTHLMRIFSAMRAGKNGGTFIAESRTYTPISSCVIPLWEIDVPVRLTVDLPADTPRSKVVLVEPPTVRECWRYTGWVLGPLIGAVRILPATSPFLLCRALPQHYTESEGGDLLFSAKAIESRAATSAEYVDMLLEYTKKVSTADDNVRAAAVKAAKVSHGRSGAAASAGSMAFEKPPTPNKQLDMSDHRMRQLAMVHEVATCMVPALVVMARARKLQGRHEDAAACAASVILQTACLQGPDSVERVLIQQFMTESNLL